MTDFLITEAEFRQAFPMLDDSILWDDLHPHLEAAHREFMEMLPPALGTAVANGVTGNQFLELSEHINQFLGWRTMHLFLGSDASNALNFAAEKITFKMVRRIIPATRPIPLAIFEVCCAHKSSDCRKKIQAWLYERKQIITPIPN